MTNHDPDLPKKYYLHFAAAFVRGKLPDLETLSDEETVQRGLTEGLRLHRFKRSSELPRVRKVLGILRGLAPADLLDIGSGRGVFLWPLLDSFPWLPVHIIDQREDRVADVEAVARGGVENLQADRMDVCHLQFEDDAFDVVTILEVLEHLEEPAVAAQELVRVGRRFIVASVPSKEDDNPEHIQLFTQKTLEELFCDVGAKNVKFDYVLNHIITVAKL